MSSVFTSTVELLKSLRVADEAVLVAFSGGKDSLVVLDLCSRVFSRVVAFYMYFVPGLSFIEEQLAAASKRWSCEILQYPHRSFIDAIKGGVFCNNYHSFDDLPSWKPKDIYNLVSMDTGIKLVCTGAKEADFWQRKSMLKKEILPGVHPLQKWNKFDVMAYLKHHNIPLPECSGRMATGVDLSAPSILWLHDTHRSDFEKLCEWFPYAEAVVKRREFYGISS